MVIDDYCVLCGDGWVGLHCFLDSWSLTLYLAVTSYHPQILNKIQTNATFSIQIQYFVSNQNPKEIIIFWPIRVIYIFTNYLYPWHAHVWCMYIYC